MTDLDWKDEKKALTFVSDMAMTAAKNVAANVKSGEEKSYYDAAKEFAKPLIEKMLEEMDEAKVNHRDLDTVVSFAQDIVLAGGPDFLLKSPLVAKSIVLFAAYGNCD